MSHAPAWQLTIASAFALVILASTAWIMIDASLGRSIEVPRSPYLASWLRGLATGHLTITVFVVCLLAFSGAYGGLLPLARRLPTRPLVAFIVVLYALVFISPVIVSTDVFSYIAYARMGAIHGLNPYVSVPLAIRHDPIYRFVGVDWIAVPSAYGPLYTIFSYPFALLGVIGSVWGMKAVSLFACGAVDWLTWRCAQRRGVDPKLALMIVALNPLVVIYSLASAQNDFLMVALTMLAILLTLNEARAELARSARVGRWRLNTRETWSGALLVAAALVKVSAAVPLPFMLIRRRRSSSLVGALAAVGVGVVVAYAVFGVHGISLLSGVSRDSALVSYDGFAREIAHMLGKPGVFPVDHLLLNVALVLIGVYLLARTWAGYDWIAASGWALLATAVMTTWLQPWYLIWPLPLATISRDRRLLWGTLLVQSLFVIHQLAPLFSPS
ncbi:MAG: polyprenol phosphomannose-dependent alpha 1,6 mannosyltransferase MptB [Solirubrobacterales bacterium]|nr:polyprenol phosphomannose-dependent alpha 1,6 mannosyltransferase MptB [Solirubrobacterales bacterium]